MPQEERLSTVSKSVTRGRLFLKMHKVDLAHSWLFWWSNGHHDNFVVIMTTLGFLVAVSPVGPVFHALQEDPLPLPYPENNK